MAEVPASALGTLDITQITKLEKSKLESILKQLYKSEKKYQHHLQHFVDVLLEGSNHSLEDMLLHQIELPAARQLVGFEGKTSVVSLVFRKLATQSLNTLAILSELIIVSAAEKAPFSIAPLTKHLEKNVCPILEAAALIWEWTIQAIGLWKTTEFNFSARLPDYMQKYNEGDNINLESITFYLLMFPRSISPDSVLPPKSKLFKNFMKFSSMLENLFSLPVLRLQNYHEALTVLLDTLPSGCGEHFYVAGTAHIISDIFKPIMNQAEEHQRVLLRTENFPLAIQEKIVKMHRKILYDGDVCTGPKKKKKRLLIFNDLLLLISEHNDSSTPYKIISIPKEMHCSVVGNCCESVTSFGLPLWCWECDQPHRVKNALLKARRFVTMRSWILFNRSGGSVEALLPIEFLRLAADLQSSKSETNQPLTVAQMMNLLQKDTIRPSLLEGTNTPNETMEWIFKSNASTNCNEEQLRDLVDDPLAYPSLLHFSKETYCSEIILFFKAVEVYKKLRVSLPGQPVEAKAIEISENFIIADAPLEVNLELVTKETIMENICHKRFDEDLFNEAQDFVTFSILEDLLPQYLKSEHLDDLLCSYSDQSRNTAKEKGSGYFGKLFSRKQKLSPQETTPKAKLKKRNRTTTHITPLQKRSEPPVPVPVPQQEEGAPSLHRRSSSLEFQFQGTSFAPKS